MVANPAISLSKRIILWPKGNFTLGSYLPQNSLTSNLNGKDAVSLALRVSWYFLYGLAENGIEGRWIGWEEWKKLAAQKLKFTDEFSYYLFSVAKGFEEEASLGNKKGKVDFMLLAFALAFQNSQNSENSLRNSSNFVKLNFEKLLILSLIFDPVIQDQFLCCSQLKELPKITSIDAKLLKLCDHFLEGTVIDKKESTKVTITPYKFSEIVINYWADDNQEILFSKLLEFSIDSLQSDMYALDEFEIKTKKLPLSNSIRSITSTILPQHRKLSIRNWSHMEILNNTVYRSINLRVSDGNLLSKSSFIFHLTTLKTVVISDSSEISPIVLGPVTDFVILRNLHNCRISVVTKRILIIDCDNLMIFCNSETRPIIVGASFSLCFAPYNVWFNALDLELDQANLALDNFNDPIYVDSTYASEEGNEKMNMKAEERFQILPEAEFYLQPTPLPSSLPYSKSFLDCLGGYLSSFVARKSSAVDYLKKLTMPEIELITPLSTDDLHYLKKKISSTTLTTT